MEIRVTGALGALGGILVVVSIVCGLLISRPPWEGIVLSLSTMLVTVFVMTLVFVRFAKVDEGADARPEVFADAAGVTLRREPLTEREIAARKERLALLLAEADAMPTIDHRTADDIIGYNERGHFD